MSAHDPTANIDSVLVQRLLSGQFPQWAALPLAPVASAGTDNAIFRLGANLAVRLPLRQSAAPLAKREQRWLPHLAPHLPLAIPTPVGAGTPADGYPWAWSVCSWVDGEDAATAGVQDLAEAAAGLGRFLAALRAIDAAGGPPAGPDNHGRGVALALLDSRVRRDIARLEGEIDGRAALAVWEEALAAPLRGRPGVWVHGDIHPGNLLVRDGRIVSVLDFGLLGVGDPACDMLVAWSFLDAPARIVFRNALGVDQATWTRGRGWAVFNAVITLAFYLETNPALCAIGRRTLTELSRSP